MLLRSIFRTWLFRSLQDSLSQIPARMLGARALMQFLARTRPLVVAGRYDRAPIIAASKAATGIQEHCGVSLTEAMSSAFAATWQVAKAARFSTTLCEHGRFERAQQPVHPHNLLTVMITKGEDRALQGGNPSPTQPPWPAHSPAQLSRAARVELSA